MLRFITLMPGELVPVLLATGLLAGSAGMTQADPRLVYTRHSLKIDVRDLDLSRDADQRIFRARIADAANQVCGGRPDRGNRYTQAELKRMLPAYDQCRAK